MMTAEKPYPSSALTSLRKRWAWVALFCAAWLAAGFFFLDGRWQRTYTLRWLALASAGSLYLMWTLWRGLEHNRRAGESQLLGTLGLGNQLTLLRGGLTAALAGFLFSPRPAGWLAWIPGALYTLAAIIDLFDGYAARRMGQATRLGERLDLSLDGVGVLTAGVLAVQYQQAPAWYLLVATARYLFMAGVWLRKRRGLAVYNLPASSARRPLAGAQMGFIAVILWPLFSPPGTYIAAFLFAAPFLAGFVRDWLGVSGASLGNKGSKDRIAALKERITSHLPVLLRAIVVVLFTGALLADLHSGIVLTNPYSNQASPYSSPWVVAIATLQGVGTLLLALGAAGRTAALALLFSIELQLPFAGLRPAGILLVLCTTALFFLGTGAYSLWKPEDRLIYRRLGEG